MEDTRRPAGQGVGTARWKAWKAFQTAVAGAASWAEVRELAAHGPAPGQPGSSFYSNLIYFVRYRSLPLGADGAQVAIYDGLVARLGTPTAHPSPVGAPLPERGARQA